MNERWRLLIDPALPGSINMARDEAMQQIHARNLTLPTLRLYAWQPACLSLGRFQHSAALQREACNAAGIQIVRRPSGGRALLHDDELTYAVVAHTDHALIGGESIGASYRSISLVFVEALRTLGVQASLAPRQRAGDGGRRAGAGKHAGHDTRGSEDQDIGIAGLAGWGAGASAPPHLHTSISSACFDAPTAYELTIDGRKLIGSAQMRREHVLLQHGALPLSEHAQRLATLLNDTPVDLAQRMIALDQAAQRRIESTELTQALIQAFAQVWQIELVPGTWLPEELELAEDLQREKYENAEWTFQR